MRLVEADEQRLGALEARACGVAQKRTQLLVDATEEAPEVKELNPQIGELESQIKDLRGRKSSVLADEPGDALSPGAGKRAGFAQVV